MQLTHTDRELKYNMYSIHLLSCKAVQVTLMLTQFDVDLYMHVCTSITLISVHLHCARTTQAPRELGAVHSQQVP